MPWTPTALPLRDRRAAAVALQRAASTLVQEPACGPRRLPVSTRSVARKLQARAFARLSVWRNAIMSRAAKPATLPCRPSEESRELRHMRARGTRRARAPGGRPRSITAPWLHDEGLGGANRRPESSARRRSDSGSDRSATQAVSASIWRAIQCSRRRNPSGRFVPMSHRVGLDSLVRHERRRPVRRGSRSVRRAVDVHQLWATSWQGRRCELQQLKSPAQEIVPVAPPPERPSPTRWTQPRAVRGSLHADTSWCRR